MPFEGLDAQEKKKDENDSDPDACEAGPFLSLD
jgi:hypothetical protein